MGSGEARQAETRITRLERLYKEQYGSLTFDYTAYPVRSLTLTEEDSTGSDGSSTCVLVATWTSPAGNITPQEIRIKVGDTTEYISGSSQAYRIYGHVPGETVSVSVTALYAGDNFSSTVTASITLTGDSVAPGQPFNATVTSGFRTLTITWENPADDDLYHTEIWESRTNSNIETAERIAQAYGIDFVRANCGVLETRWFWLRAVDKAGNKSDFIGPYSGTTNALQAVDIPEASIEQSKLATILSQSIDEIPVIDNKIEGLYTLRVNSNGNIAGFALGSDGTTSEMAIVADHFFIAKADGTATTIFEVNTTTGLVQLVGSLIAAGSITGDKINAASQIALGTGGSFVAGDGSIVQIGTNDKVLFLDSETGRIVVRNSSNTNEYIEITAGDATTYKEIDSHIVPLKSLRQMYTDTVDSSNSAITIGGSAPVAWASVPKIMVSPSYLNTYLTTGTSQNQKLRCQALNITRDSTTGYVTFIPKATLEVEASTSGNVLSDVRNKFWSSRYGWTNVTDGTDKGVYTYPLTCTSVNIPAYAVNIRITCRVYGQHNVKSGWDWATPVYANVIANFGGADTQLAYVQCAMPGYEIPTITDEPTGMYTTVTGTLSGGVSSDQALTLRTVFTTNTTQVQNTNPQSRTVQGCWMRVDSVYYEFTGGSVLATGQLNYIAIAE